MFLILSPYAWELQLSWRYRKQTANAAPGHLAQVQQVAVRLIHHPRPRFTSSLIVNLHFIYQILLGGRDFTGKENFWVSFCSSSWLSPSVPASGPAAVTKCCQRRRFLPQASRWPQLLPTPGLWWGGILGEPLCNPAEHHQEADAHWTAAHHFSLNVFLWQSG